MRLQGKKIAILVESDYYEPEIWYYQRRFAEEGAEVHFLTRLWGQAPLELPGHEYKAPFEVRRELRGHQRRGAAQLRRGHRALGDGRRPAPLHRGRHQAAAGDRVHAARLRSAGHPQRHYLPRHVAGGPGSRSSSAARVVAHNNLHGDVRQHGRRLRRRGRRRRRRPRHRRGPAAHCHLFARRSSTCWPETTPHSGLPAPLLSRGE